MHQLLWDAINPYTGRTYTWDDPNLFFGADDLGYARDSWDEGFIPYVIPPHPSSASSTRRTTMTRQNYFPTRQSDQAVWTNA